MVDFPARAFFRRIAAKCNAGVLLAVAIASVANSADGQISGRWTVLTLTRDGVISFDSSTVDRRGPRVYEVWFRDDVDAADSVKVRRYGDASFSHSLSRYRVDCSGRRVTMLALTHYDTTGNVLRSNETPDAKWSLVLPESVGEDFYKAFCDVIEKKAREPQVWLIKGTLGDRFSQLRVTITTEQILTIVSTVGSTHQLSVDTTGYDDLTLDRLRAVLTISAVERLLDERGDDWDVYGLPVGSHRVVCETHPSNFREKLLINVVARPQKRPKGLGPRS